MIAASPTLLPRRRSLTIWALFAVFMVVTSYVVAILIAFACFSLVPRLVHFFPVGAWRSNTRHHHPVVADTASR